MKVQKAVAVREAASLSDVSTQSNAMSVFVELCGTKQCFRLAFVLFRRCPLWLAVFQQWTALCIRFTPATTFRQELVSQVTAPPASLFRPCPLPPRRAARSRLLWAKVGTAAHTQPKTVAWRLLRYKINKRGQQFRWQTDAPTLSLPTSHNSFLSPSDSLYFGRSMTNWGDGEPCVAHRP